MGILGFGLGLGLGLTVGMGMNMGVFGEEEVEETKKIY